MKNVLLLILVCLFMVSSVPQVQASFRIRKALVTSRTENTATETKKDNLATLQEVLAHPFESLQNRGWVAITALVFGIVGFIVPLFSIGAVLFGFLGMGRRNRNRGLAIAGLVLGLTVLALTIFFGFSPL